MCDPVTIGSALLTAAGTEMQYQAQKKAQRGIDSAIRTNGESNDRLRQESQGKVQESAQQFSREKFDETQNQETDKAKQLFEKSISQGSLPGEYYGGMQSDNTKRYTEQQTDKTNKYSTEIAGALARLRGFDQGQGVNTRSVQRASEVVGMNQNKETGNNAILPLQIEAAKQKGSTPLGDIFVGVGSAGLTAGLSGGAPSLTQGSLSRSIAGTPYGPVNGFGGTGFSLV